MQRHLRIADVTRSLADGYESIPTTEHVGRGHDDRRMRRHVRAGFRRFDQVRLQQHRASADRRGIESLRLAIRRESFVPVDRRRRWSRARNTGRGVVQMLRSRGYASAPAVTTPAPTSSARRSNCTALARPPGALSAQFATRHSSTTHLYP